MPVAPVGSGVDLYYEDSGPPDGGASYTTLVLVHGVIFHGATFRRMLPFAAAHNLRVVMPNLRDYPGSTPYAPAELAAFDGPDLAAQAAALRAHGEEIAAFLAWLIESEHLPAIRSRGIERPGADARGAGGIALLGWSGGNTATISMVAHAAALPEARRTLLEAHLRTLILFDPTLTVLGIEPPPRLYCPLRDAALSLEARAAAGGLWLSAYYDNAEPHPARAGAAVEPAALRDPPPHQAPSVARMSAADLAQIADVGAVLRAHARILAACPGVLRANVARALALGADADAGVDALPCWPGLAVRVVWCDRTMGDAAYGTWALERMCEAAEQRAGKPVGRLPHTEFVRMEEANHFVLWDEPERSVSFLMSII